MKKGAFGATKLDGVLFAAVYLFPGLVEHGNGTARLYVDDRATAAQRKALEAIYSGKHGGGVFQVFAGLVTKAYQTKAARVEFEAADGKGRVKIEGILEGESELLSYPDGTTIRPFFTLPHGIEFKTGLATNGRRWGVRDEHMLATHQNKYAVVTTVKFTQDGCVG